ncbi:MAG TPA: transketolase C-terminal domain-containing protein [Chlamydiales bacterium]|nr:transketolase C-terminal domain-containing protein [Chlamydiales bacterium]
MKKIRQEFADTMVEIGRLDPKLIVMVGDISHGILQPFAQQCPGRYFNVGICEPTIVNMAAGVAKTGLIPVVHTIAPFIIERAYEQIKLDFGYQKLGVNLISVGSAFDYSQLGCSHHCYTDFSLMSHFKNSHVFFPSSPIEFNLLFKAAYKNREINYFRLPETPHGVELDPGKIEIGKAIKIRDGEDLTIVVVGPQLKTALQASYLLSNRGLSVDLLYYPTIKPFDQEATLLSIAKTKRVLVIEEASSHDGIFNFVLRTVKHLSGVEYGHISIDDFIHQYGTYDELCDLLGFSVAGILKSIESSFVFKEKCIGLSV